MCHTGIKINQSETEVALQRSHGICELAAACCSRFWHEFLLFSAYFFMSEDWHKYLQILEREDEEFRRAMQEEVSIVSILLNLIVNNRILAGTGIITQP